MRSRVVPVTLVAVVLASAAIVSAATSGSAQENGGGGPCANCGNNGAPTTTPDGFYDSVGTAIHAVNNGGSTSGGPPPCDESDLFAYADPDPEVNHTGHFEYVTPLNSQETLNAISQTTASGTWWRLVCVFDDGFVPSDDLVDVHFFAEINGRAIAGWVVDQALTRVPAPQPRMSPDGADQLVNLETWLWVDGVPDTSFPGPSVSVPGITVTVEVSTGGVWWEMGDGSPGFPCDIGTPYAAGGTPTCTYTYRTSSARQPDETFHGTASIRWTARYWVNGNGPFEVADAVVRETPFSVQVSEGEAVVTG